VAKPSREAHASVRFVAKELDPSEITRRLILPPDHVHRRGDLRIVRTKRGRVRTYSPYREGIWTMSSEGWVSGANLGTHLAWLLDQLEPRRAEITEILGQGVRGDLFCYWYADHAPNIPREIRARAEALGLEIGVDQHQPFDDEDIDGGEDPPGGGCVLLVEGDFDPNALVSNTKLRPYQVWRAGELGLPGNPKTPHENSGMKFLLSKADAFEDQVRDVEGYLRGHEADLRRVLSHERVQRAYLDFANTCRLHDEGVAVQQDLLPAALVSLCGKLGVAIAISTYPEDNG